MVMEDVNLDGTKYGRFKEFTVKRPFYCMPLNISK
jgi:hypothetical protein